MKSSLSDLDALNDMRRKQSVLRAQLDAHDAACVARGPHGYIVCQIARERIETRLARVERAIVRLTRSGPSGGEKARTDGG